MRFPRLLHYLSAISVGFCTIVSSAKAAPPTTEELERQVQQLRTELNLYRIRQEDLIFESTERLGSVRSFFSNRLSLGGFFETGLSGFWGEDMSTQVTPASNVLGLNFAAIFASDFKFVAQVLTAFSIPLQNENSDPRATAVGLPARREFRSVSIAAAPTQAYVEYVLSDAFRLQGGIGYVPFGYAPQQREVVLFVRRSGPQMLRTQDLVEPLWSGVHLAGQLNWKSGRWGYDAYTFPYLTYTQMMGGGSRLWWESSEEMFRAGVSSQAGRSRTGGAFTLGLDFRVKLGDFTLNTEYAQRSTDGRRPWTMYAEPNYTITPSFLVYAFADYADAALNRTANQDSLEDPYKRLEYGAGLNWLPTAFTRFRIGLFLFDYRGATAEPSGQDRDFAAVDLSAGVAF